MNLVSQIKGVKSKVSGTINFGESLSKHSWFNLGGPAKVVYRPKNLSDLSTFLKNLKGVNKIKVFLEEGNKAKITLRFRGREMAHQNIGMKLLKIVEEDLENIGSIEQFPGMEGRQLVMLMAPIKK